jgi:maltooligosyltrehalose trehalohydrolase
LYARLLEVRRRLPHAGVDAIELDEDARWLRLRRGEFEMICNFASRSQPVPCAGASVVLATHDEPAPAVRDAAVELEPMSGALVA